MKLFYVLTFVLLTSAYVNLTHAESRGNLRILNDTGIPIKLYGAGIKKGGFVQIDDGKSVDYTHGYGQAGAGQLSGIIIEPSLDQAVDENKKGVTIENHYEYPGNLYNLNIEMTRFGGGRSSDSIPYKQSKTFKPSKDQVKWKIRGNMVQDIGEIPQ